MPAKGFRHSEESKQQMRDSWKTRPPMSEEAKRNIGNAVRNRPPATEETRKRMSDAAKNRPPMSDETRQRMSDAKKGRARPKGEHSSGWKGGKTKGQRGYITVYALGHPNADCHNRVLEHRLVMEEFLGRYLAKDEVVHHIDFNKVNNEIENLFLFPSGTSHSLYHRAVERIMKRYALSKQDAAAMLHPEDFINSTLIKKTGESNDE